jgi:nucleotide-binding universal stress UspA family protein
MARRTQSSPFRRVLIGCDGSPEGSDAVALGAALATLCDAGITLAGIYAYSWLPMPRELTISNASLKRETEVMLGRERDQRAPGAHIVAEPDRSVARALRRISRRERADLIVLGSTSRAPAGRTEPGPHARQLLSNAPSAAAVAPRGYHERSPALQRIAVGYDGGEEAKTALAVAAELARRAGGRVRIHEVIDNRVPIGVSLAVDAITGRAIDWGALINAEQDEARRRVDQAAASLSLAADATVSVGDPRAELRKLSDEADLIVLGSLHLARRERLAIGATAERVLEGTACPVLVVPRPQVQTAESSPPTRSSQRRRRRTEVAR